MSDLYEGSWSNWGRDEASEFLRKVKGMTGERCYVERIEVFNHPSSDFDVYIRFTVSEIGRLRWVFAHTSGTNITMMSAEEIGAELLRNADEYIAAKAAA